VEKAQQIRTASKRDDRTISAHILLVGKESASVEGERPEKQRQLAKSLAREFGNKPGSDEESGTRVSQSCDAA
jgi:hypothetical protein